MPWTMGILLFTMSVIMLSSSLRAGPESFFESNTPYGAVSENTIRLGKLLIGAQDVVSDKKMEISGIREQSDEYRSNEEERFRLAKAKLRRLGPSVYCGNDSMTLRIPGSRTPRLLIDRGTESPVSLSEMPASCGFSLKRVRRDVSLGAPYQGCHVRQQGGHYILPLLMMGAPVQMSCPVTQPTLAPTTVAPVQDPIDSQQMFYPFPFGKPMSYPPYSHDRPDVRPIAPTVPPTTTSPLQDPQQQMVYPFPFGKPMSYPPYSHYRPDVRPIPPTVPPTTTSPLQDPQQQMVYPFPFGKPMSYPPYSHYRPDVRPIAPTVPPTTTTPLQDPQQKFPLQDPQQQMVYPFPFGKPMSYPPYSHDRPGVAPTVPTTTTPLQDPRQKCPLQDPQQQMLYPFPFGKPMSYPPYSHDRPGVAPTVPPTTTTPLQDPRQKFPLQDPQQQMFYPFPFGKPMSYPPYSHDRPGVRPIAPTVPPTMTTPLQDPRQKCPRQNCPLQDPQQQMFYPSPFGKPMSYPPYSHDRPGVAPTVPPTMTTPLQDPRQKFPLQDPQQQMFYPFPFGKPMSYPPYSHDRPGVAPTVPPTMTTPLQDPRQKFPLQDPQQQMFYPFPFGKPMSYPPYSHDRLGVAPTVPPTTTTPLQDPQQKFPQIYPMSMFDPDHFNSRGFPAPWHHQSRYPKFPSYMHHFETPATTTPSTTAAQFDQFAGYPPLYPKFYGPPPFEPPRVPVPFMPQYH